MHAKKTKCLINCTSSRVPLIEMTGVSIIRAGTAHERKESKANTIRVSGKQHDFRTVMPTLRLNQRPSDL